jgi:hypothetical protein
MSRVLDVPVLVRSEVQDRKLDRQMATQLLYTPPLDGSVDPHREFDAFIAKRIHEILSHHFPGYPWDVKCSAAQGMIWFAIPVLMGPTLNWAIKLAQWGDLNPKLVIDGGGELLERMHLPRKGFEVMSFLESRDNRHNMQFDHPGRR